ncbi:MAG: putative 4-mercaptohistidine N1-methyltransferase [Limisphaerales bacterium]
MPQNYYDSDRAAAEYLILHYGKPEPRLPKGLALGEAAQFVPRCVSECLDARRLPAASRALDLGCAVGRASFELARHCAEVIGIDASRRFIDIAGSLRAKGSFSFRYIVEGELTQTARAVVPAGIDRRRVKFMTGDATRPPSDLGVFDVVLMSNLIDRLGNPAVCLKGLPRLLKSGGQLILVSPYSWLREYTPRAHWLGGCRRGGRDARTFAAIRRLLRPHFSLARRLDLPFLIREHERKFQLGVAEASVWLRR